MKKQAAIGLLILAALAGCSTTNDTTMTTTRSEPAATAPVATTEPAAAVPSNPLLREWTGPYGGVPPFDEIKVEHFIPALEAAMAENLAEIDRIANNPEPP